MNIIAKRIIYGALFSLSIFSTVHAETSGQGQMMLSLRDGVLKLLENNLDVTIERISPEIAETKILREKGVYDLQAFGSFKREDATTPLSARESVSAGGLKTIKSEAYSLDAGLTGKTPIGTEYTLEAKNNWTSETLNDFNFEYSSFSGVRVTQPLLKDFVSNTNELNINIAKKDRDISTNKLKQRILDSVSDYGFAYWDLVRAREELKVRMESERLAGMLVDINRKKFEAGTGSNLDVIQAEATEAARKDDVILAEKTVRERENTLKLLISKDVYSLKDIEIVPTDSPMLIPVREGLDESVTKAINVRPDYLETKTELEKNRIQIKYAKGQTFPKIDLEASYGYSGLGPTFAKSYNGIDANPDWSLGIVFRYPLENRTARGDLKIARLEADQAILRLKKLEQQIILNIDQALKDIKSDDVRVNAAKVSTRLAEETLAAEEKKLEAGRSTTYNLLKIQEDLAKARLNEISAIVDYNKALVQFNRQKGVLLEDMGINLVEAAKGR